MVLSNGCHDLTFPVSLLIRCHFLSYEENGSEDAKKVFLLDSMSILFTVAL